MTNSYRSIRKGAIAASLLTIGSFAAPAMAQDDEFTFRFAYDAAELQTDAQAQQLNRRLVADANAACRHRAPSAQRTVNTTCRADLINSVTRSIGSERLEQIQQAAPANAQPVQTASRQG